MAFDARSWGRFLTAAAKIIRGLSAGSSSGTSAPAPRSKKARSAQAPRRPAPRPEAVHPGIRYPGDFTGVAKLSYNPDADGTPDPGEIVWTWVPFEEDHSRGKDRPVLLVGTAGAYLLAVMLTSKDHNSIQHQDPDYIDIGTGPWDSKGRPSEVKLNRILQISPADVRREGAILDPKKFERVAQRLRTAHGWS